MMMAPRPPLLPRELQPNDYFVITLVVAVACGLLNLTSLFFSVPAVICSAIVSQTYSSFICMYLQLLVPVRVCHTRVHH